MNAMSRQKVSTGCWNSVPRKEGSGKKTYQEGSMIWDQQVPSTNSILWVSRERFSSMCWGRVLTLSHAVSSQEGDVWKCWAPWCQRDDGIMEEHRPWRGRDQPSKSRITWLTRCKTMTTHRGLYPQESSGSRSSSGQDEEPADKGILYL